MTDEFKELKGLGEILFINACTKVIGRIESTPDDELTDDERTLKAKFKEIDATVKEGSL